MENNLDLNVNQSVQELMATQFEDLSELLNVIPGFNDDSEFEAVRKDPLAMLNTPSLTVDKVGKLISLDVASGIVQYIKAEYLRVCVGNYSIGKANLNFSSELIICQYGITFSVPHTSVHNGQEVNLCIPITDIMALKIYNGKKMCVLGISTGSAHAAWVRNILGMEDSLEVVDNALAPFYGPLVGGHYHKWIILLIPTLSQEDFAKLKTLFLHSQGDEYICDVNFMGTKEAQEFVSESKIFSSI